MIPIRAVKTGVSEFRKLASELSIFVSAMQNKNAGKKLPKRLDKNINRILLTGIFLNCLTATGNNTIPPLNILSAATWYGLNAFMPSFMSIKELPQIKASIKNIAQFSSLSLGWPILKFA
jgi:hypothetical protein